MIRGAEPRDVEAILSTAEASGIFDPPDLVEVRGMLENRFGEAESQDQRWIVDDDDGNVVAVAYYTPERLTAGTWNLHMLVVHPDKQGQGRGATLIRHVEDELRQCGGRLLIVETLGIDDFEGQRSFYLKNGFEREATIRNFYDAGFDKVVFAKPLATGE